MVDRRSAPTNGLNNSLRTPSATQSNQVGMFPSNTTSAANYRTGSMQDQPTNKGFLGGVKGKIGGAFRRGSLLNSADVPGANTDLASLPETFDI